MVGKKGHGGSKRVDGSRNLSLEDLGPPPPLPRICILDADDSYTNSIVKLISDVYPAGSPEKAQIDERVIVLRGRDIGTENLVKILPEFGAIILGPGPGRPVPVSNPAAQDGAVASTSEASKEFAHPAGLFTHLLSEATFPNPIPTLGICLGHQALACAYGAKVVQAPHVLHGQISRLQLELDADTGKGKGVMRAVKDGERVVRYNSLTVDPATVADPLEITAWSHDGKERTVMGLRHRTHPFWAVQYHPESVCSDNGSTLMSSFLRLVGESEHVKTHLTPEKAFSTLPLPLLQISRICNSYNSARNPYLAHLAENGFTHFWEMRTQPLGRPGPSPHTPQDVFEVLVKGATPLGEVWLDSAKFPTPPRPTFGADAAKAKEAAAASKGESAPPKANGHTADASTADEKSTSPKANGDASHGSESNTTATNGASAESTPTPDVPWDEVPWPPPGEHNSRYSHLASADVLVSYFGNPRMAWVTGPENRRQRVVFNGGSKLWDWLCGTQEVVKELTKVLPVGEAKWYRENWDERIKNGEKPGPEIDPNAPVEGEAGAEGAEATKKVTDGTEAEKKDAPSDAKPHVNGDEVPSDPAPKVNGDAHVNGDHKGEASTNGVNGHAEANTAKTEPAPLKQWPKRDHSNVPLPPVGFLGYVGYELLSESLDGHRIPSRGHPEGQGIPDAELAFSNCAFTYDHVERQWYASALVRLEQEVNLHTALLVETLERRLGNRLGFSEEEYASFMQGTEQTFIIEEDPEVMAEQELELQKEAEHAATHAYRPIHLKPLNSEVEYLCAVDRAQQQIDAGESYELCLTTTFKSALQRKKGADKHPKTNPADPCPVHDVGSHYPLYLKLREANPAPHSAYIRFAPYDTTVLSSSPERFMRIDREGNVEMKPIKGTARRRLDDDVEDQKIKTKLRGDLKERAECLMITDLIRHDLLGFCEIDSVSVPKLLHVETNATVHNLVSTVVGKMKPNLNAADALKMTFPPGSMTGAPKLRSVELLDELERGTPRGIYSGVLGYLGVDGTADWSVVIRTAVIRDRQLTIGGGGAITSLSKRDHEWQEVLAKVNAVAEQLSQLSS